MAVKKKTTVKRKVAKPAKKMAVKRKVAKPAKKMAVKRKVAKPAAKRKVVRRVKASAKSITHSTVKKKAAAKCSIRPGKKIQTAEGWRRCAVQKRRTRSAAR